MVSRQYTFAVTYKLKRYAKENFILKFCHNYDKLSTS